MGDGNANTDHSSAACRTGNFNPSPPFKIRPRTVGKREKADFRGRRRLRDARRVGLWLIRPQFAYLLGLRRAPAQVRRELDDLDDRLAGYLREV
jgi:hypothetical protein